MTLGEYGEILDRIRAVLTLEEVEALREELRREWAGDPMWDELHHHLTLHREGIASFAPRSRQ